MPSILNVVNDTPQFDILVDSQGKVLYSDETIAREAALRAEVARLRAAASEYISITVPLRIEGGGCAFCLTAPDMPHAINCRYILAQDALKQEPTNA